MDTISREEFLLVWNNTDEYPTSKDVNKHFNKTGDWAKEKAKYLRKVGLDVIKRSSKKQLLEDSFIVKSKSTLYDADGNVKMEWQKTSLDEKIYQENMKKAITALFEDIEGKADPVEKPMMLDEDLTTFYPLPDLHYGVLISGEESNHGYDYDLKKARRWVLSSIKHLVDAAPKSKYAVIGELGDFLHASDNSARTKSGHALDTDSRHYTTIKIAFEVTKLLVEETLKKHEQVYFYSVPGNHSENSGIYLKAYLSAWFRDEPRVHIVDDAKCQQYHIFGKNIIGFSHGHELKPERAPTVLVYDNQEVFSSTEYRYFHFGHYHSNKHFETPLCNVEIHKNIIPRDAWAEGMGFRGHIGEAKCITYHREFGEVGRSKFNIRMIGE